MKKVLNVIIVIELYLNLPNLILKKKFVTNVQKIDNYQ